MKRAFPTTFAAAMGRRLGRLAATGRTVVLAVRKAGANRAMMPSTGLVLTIAGCTVVAVLAWHGARVQRNLVRDTAFETAAQQIRTIELFRYLTIPDVPAADGAVDAPSPSDKHGSFGMTPLPGSTEFVLASKVTRASSGGDALLYSPYPFPSNPGGGLPDRFAAAAWQALREDPERPFHRYETIDGQRMLRYAVAEQMRDECISCHNSLPVSPKRNWRDGDLAGVIEVMVPIDGKEELAWAAVGDALLVVAGLGTVGLLLLGVLMRRAKNTASKAQELAEETETVNRSLEREIGRRSRVETELSLANERLSSNHSQLERWAADLEIAHSRLREVDGLKTKFLSDVSHELRSPVAAICSAAKIITKHHASKPDVVERFGKTIVSESERMTRLINDFLDLTKIESGSVDWNDAEIDLAELVNDVILGADALALDSGVRLVAKVKRKLPHIEVDADRLFQVLTNLVSNAIKFTPQGGTVTVRAEEVDGEIRFAVEDTGPGIPEDQISHVFDRFRQVHSTQNDGKKRVGTGLGLCISREIVQHYGGRIWVESEVGKGSSFLFTIPIADAIHGAAGAGDAAGQMLSPRVLILISDDDRAARAAAASIDAGLECRACSGVEEIESVCAEWTPDVYIVSADIVRSPDSGLPLRIHGEGMAKLLVDSPEHGLTTPAMFDSSDLLVPSLKAFVTPGATILIVEDDPQYRSLLEFDLQHAGYSVLTVENGRDALIKIREKSPDAVILDLIMPGMDGLTLLERLAKSDSLHVPILVYTAMDDPGVALAAKDLGAAEVFRKDGTGQACYTAVAMRVQRMLAPALAVRVPPTPDEAGPANRI